MARRKAQNQPEQDPTIKEVWDTIPDDIKDHVCALIGDIQECEKTINYLRTANLNHSQRVVIHLLIGLSLEQEEITETTDLIKIRNNGRKFLGDLNYI